MKPPASEERIVDKLQLVEYFSTAAVPKERWRTGIECEIFAVNEDSLLSVPFYGKKGIESILKQMARDYGWTPVLEGSAVIGLSKGDCTVSLEPGGQIELSCSPYSLIADCIQEQTSFINQLKEITFPMGVRLMTMGYHPVAELKDVEWVPKKRYKAMSEYFLEKGGYLAHHMMKLTTSLQTSIDYENEADFSNKMMLASYLTPIIQAMYANSPFKKNDFSGSLDFRGMCWEHTDNDRCGLFRKAFSGNFGFEDYTNYLLDMPMIVRFDEQEAIPMNGMSFNDYWRSRPLPMREWHSHVSFAFPEIRLRKYIELRMCDSVPEHLLHTVPALLKGLFYDTETRSRLTELFKDITADQALGAYKEVHQKALQGSMAGRPIIEFAKEVVSLADQGLNRLGREGLISTEEEQSLLDPLKEQICEKGVSPAEELVRLWEKSGRKISALKDKILL